jgi:hypothetical protein
VGGVFHCRGTVRLVAGRVATPLPAVRILLRDITILFRLPRGTLPDGWKTCAESDFIDFAGEVLVLITS